MGEDADRRPLFGERAVARGFVSEADVQEALRAQHEARVLFGKHIYLGEILLLQRKLTARALAELLAEAGERPDPIEDVHGRRFFGDVAIELGFCTAQHIAEALDAQRAEETAGRRRRLVGEILFERGYLTSGQVERVVARMVGGEGPAGRA